MSQHLYAVMFLIEPQAGFLGLYKRYELEIFYDNCLPEGRKISFDSPNEDLKRIGFKKMDPTTSIEDYANSLKQKYEGDSVMERDWVHLLFFHGDTSRNVDRLMEDENFTFG